MEWIKITEKMPEPGNIVLSFGKNTILRAVYIPEYFMEDQDNFLGELDYSEENDEFYWPEGWYEWNVHEDTHWKVSFEITHWMELPEYPKN